MSTQREDDLEAVLRTLKLAQAQLRSLKHHFGNDPGKESEIENAVLTIDLLMKKLRDLIA